MPCGFSYPLERYVFLWYLTAKGVAERGAVIVVTAAISAIVATGATEIKFFYHYLRDIPLVVVLVGVVLMVYHNT